jgi:hypothetical protein
LHGKTNLTIRCHDFDSLGKDILGGGREHGHILDRDTNVKGVNLGLEELMMGDDVSRTE